MAETDPSPDARHGLGWASVCLAPLYGASITPLLLAVVALLAASGGSALIDQALSGQASTAPSIFQRSPIDLTTPTVSGLPSLFQTITGPASGIPRGFVRFCDVGASPRDRLHGLVSALWLLVVWQFFGAAILRTIFVRIARGSYVGAVPSLMFGLRRGITLMVSPLAPLLVCVGLAVPGLILGLVGRIPVVGGPLSNFLGFIPLLVSLMMGMILVGLMLGWPLIPAAVAAEADDGFDAVSRMYSYVKERPLLYAVSCLLFLVAGAIGWLAAQVFAEVCLTLARVSTLSGPSSLSAWEPAIGVLLNAFAYSQFWAAVALVYLRFRQEIDNVDYRTIAAIPSPAAVDNRTEDPAATPEAATSGSPAG